MSLLTQKRRMLRCRPVTNQGLGGQYKVFVRGVLVVLDAVDCNRRRSCSVLESRILLEKQSQIHSNSIQQQQ